jgi:hypothetical protein
MNLNTDNGYNITLKISKIKSLTLKDNEQVKKYTIDNYLANTDINEELKDNILEYTFNNSTKLKPVDFSDETVFLVDENELYMEFVFETNHLLSDPNEIFEFSGSLYVYAEELEIVDTNIDLEMFDSEM